MMTNQAGNKGDARPGMTDAERLEVTRLHANLVTNQWRESNRIVERLRFSYGWRYATFVTEFGAERWESIAQHLDALDSEDEDSEAESGWDCKACEGSMETLGKLGKTEHGRCRACGMMAVK